MIKNLKFASFFRSKIITVRTKTPWTKWSVFKIFAVAVL